MTAFASVVEETFCRRAYIRIVHLSWLGIYAVLFLVPFPPSIWNWGTFIFFWSGCLLPVLISSGAFGDDIATGRIALLATKPFSLYRLFWYRVIGTCLQCVGNIGVVYVLIVALHRLTEHGGREHLGQWCLYACLVSLTWVALSTALSVLVSRDHNAIALILASVVVFLLLSSLMSFAPDHIVSKALLKATTYSCPPVIALLPLVDKEDPWLKVALVLHALGLATLYGTLGGFLLTHRELNSPHNM